MESIKRVYKFEECSLENVVNRLMKLRDDVKYTIDMIELSILRAQDSEAVWIWNTKSTTDSNWKGNLYDLVFKCELVGGKYHFFIRNEGEIVHTITQLSQ